MIPIRTYREYGKGLLSLSGIDSFLMVVSEKHLTKRLNKRDGTILAFVYPSADSMPGNVDNDGKEVLGLLFVLKSVCSGNEDEEDEFTTYENLQESLLQVEKQLKEDYTKNNEVMQHLVEDSIHIDPEYKVFGGYNGWSMSFKLNWYGK